MFGRSRSEPRPTALRDVDVDRSAVAAARHDPQRFAELYRKYLPQVYSFAFYELGDHHDAEDVTERVFLSAFAALPRFEERGEAASTFRVWLFRIARNAVSNHRRSLGRRREAPVALAGEIAGGPEPDRLAIHGDDQRRALTAIRRLPPDRRRAVILRFVEEMSIAEIAAVMERSEGAVRVLIHRALRSVARELAGTEPA